MSQTFNQQRRSERVRALHMHAGREADDHDHQVREWLTGNAFEREVRRERLYELTGRRMTYWQAEQIIALSTALEALYDLGEPQDEAICRWLRKYPNQSIDQLIQRATWVFVAK